MARPLRVEFPGAIYYITTKGNGGDPIFRSDADRGLFLDILAQGIKRYKWICHAYCLMENHYHMLVETEAGNLSLGMRHINGVYTQSFNHNHNRGGHVFQGRFKAILLEREPYLLELCRHIALNPVRTGAVGMPVKFHWSSYRATVGVDTTPDFLTTDWILSRFAEAIQEAQKGYRHFILAGLKTPSSPWSHLKGQCLLGSKEFIETIKPALKDKKKLTEIPKNQRFLARPDLKELFSGTKGDKKERNRIIRTAHLEHGYTLTSIASYLGLHYTTISKIVSNKG
ncbi:MAG: transposase [Desulfobulbaceae bacterium]|nr:transposase [Desulfobulbaceae bacterium]